MLFGHLATKETTLKLILNHFHRTSYAKFRTQVSHTLKPDRELREDDDTAYTHTTEQTENMNSSNTDFQEDVFRPSAVGAIKKATSKTLSPRR